MHRPDKQLFVTEIHVICRDRLNVEQESEDSFVTGKWRIAPQHVRPGVIFALHAERDRRSYLQGRVIEVVRQDSDRRVWIRVQKTTTPRPWAGPGTRERSYLWATRDPGRARQPSNRTKLSPVEEGATRRADSR